jgi:hypothetical protein
MPTLINPSFFDDSLIKKDDPNAWKSYTGRPNPALRNSNLQPISEVPDSHDLPINTIEIQQNNEESKREIIEPQIANHNLSLSHKPTETKNKRSKL